MPPLFFEPTPPGTPPGPRPPGRVPCSVSSGGVNINVANPWYECLSAVCYHWLLVGGASHCAEHAVHERQLGLFQSSDWPHVCLYVLKSGLKRLSSLKNGMRLAFLSLVCVLMVERPISGLGVRWQRETSTLVQRARFRAAARGAGGTARQARVSVRWASSIAVPLNVASVRASFLGDARHSFPRWQEAFVSLVVGSIFYAD